jgi:hypothetical protein
VGGGCEFLDLGKKKFLLCLIRSQAVDFYASLSSLRAVAEWAVDASRDGLLVMEGFGGFLDWDLWFYDFL